MVTQNYYEDIAKNNPTQTGIKGPCIWYQLLNFKFPRNVGAILMHDISGVSSYVLFPILNHIINKKEYITLAEFKLRTQSLKFLLKFSDTSNLPPEINGSTFKNCIFGMSASETLFLVRNLGVIVGDVIPKNESFWQLYLLHSNTVSILISPQISVFDIQEYEALVSQHHDLYQKLTKEPLKSKFHLLLHYGRIILATGPQQTPGLCVMNLPTDH